MLFNDIVWDAEGNRELCEHNSQALSEYARKFTRGQWCFSGSGSEEKWHGTCTETRWVLGLNGRGQYFVPPVPVREEKYVAKKETTHFNVMNDFYQQVQCLRSNSS